MMTQIDIGVKGQKPWSSAGVANAGPAGYFQPARAFEMARGDFLTGSDRNFKHKLALKELKLGPPRVL
jgi:hypothetical protein